MTLTLLKKLLRDVRTALIVVAILLFLFQLLWARITRNITGLLLPKVESKLKLAAQEQLKLALERLRPALEKLREAKEVPPHMKDVDVNDIIKIFIENGEQLKGIDVDVIITIFFEGEGQIIQKLIGGEGIDIRKASNLLTTGFVHPLVVTILCIWAIGRASGAIAGEIDRGTMELLLAQPISRTRVIAAHFIVDCIVIPILCLSMWAGLTLGAELVELNANPWTFWPALPNVGLLVFAVSGYTMWMSAAGRFRNRVLGRAILLTLVMFLVNVIGQLWDVMDALRPLTVFYYYQPQPIILRADWYADGAVWGCMAVLLAVGAIGYFMAWRTFTRRDLPAPL